MIFRKILSDITLYYINKGDIYENKKKKFMQKLKSKKLRKNLGKNGKSKIAEWKLKSCKKINFAITDQFKEIHFILEITLFEEIDLDSQKSVILKDAKSMILKKH